MINKFVPTIAEAMAGIPDGATVLSAGFGPGTPATLMQGLAEQGARDLTLVMNAGGRDDGPIAELLSTGHVRKLICSFVRADSIAGRLYANNQLELEIVPQGTLAERIRAGGAGIQAFYTPPEPTRSSPKTAKPEPSTAASACWNIPSSATLH